MEVSPSNALNFITFSVNLSARTKAKKLKSWTTKKVKKQKDKEYSLGQCLDLNLSEEIISVSAKKSRANGNLIVS